MKAKRKTKSKPQWTAATGTDLKEQRAEVMRQKGYVSVKEASKASLMPEVTIYRWAAQALIGSAREGRTVYVSLADLRGRVPSMAAS